MAAASVRVPRVSCSLQQTLQDQQVDLTQALFKLLLWSGVLEHVRFCVGLLRVESRFPTASGSLESKPHWPPKPNILGARLPGTGPPGWGA